MMIDYFPLATADGPAFCNRKQELGFLTNNIELARPTLIMSPRRYGKTSLVLHTLKKVKAIYTHIDFYKEIDANDIAQSIINGVGDILGQIEPKTKNLLRLAGDFFSDLQVNLSVGTLGISVELRDQKKPADKVQNILKKLHKLAERKKIKVVLYIDEFQKLADIEEHQSIEAAIRHEAQLSKHIAYIFSGSNRHLIENMFFDSNRPFYKLCDTLRLTRITKEHYTPYIQKAAQKNWKKKLSDDVIDTILNLTECHSYYVNLLCFKTWQHSFPDEKLIREHWRQCLLENRSQIEKEVDFLSLNQKKLLVYLCRYEATKQPQGKVFISKTGMSSTSLAQALKVLQEKDYVYQDNEGFYRIVDPLIFYLYAGN